MSGRTINGETGQVEQDAPRFDGSPWSQQFGAVNPPETTAPQVAAFFGVPVKWVLIAGLVIWAGSHVFKRGR